VIPNDVPRALCRYFSRDEHAHQFLSGSLLFRSLSFFKDIEDGQIRGDEHEGRFRFAPEGGLEITKSDGTRVGGFKYLVGEVKEDEIFVLCLSDAPSEQKAKAFASIRVDVTNVDEFSRRVANARPQNAPRLFSRRITYNDPRELPQERWALPELVVASKAPQFAWQDEYRLFFSCTALDIHNCRCTLSTSPPVRAVRQCPLPNPITLHIPSGLADICVVHTD